MPVILLKYKPEQVTEGAIRRLTSALPGIVSEALDVPTDPNKRLTPTDIQVWVIPSNEFDVNTKNVQMMMPVHAYPERIANLEERKETIMSSIREIIGHTVSDIGWFWILPSSDTAFGKI